MSIFHAIGDALKKVWDVITSPKAKDAVSKAASLVSLAIPIVQELAVIDPKIAKIDEVIAAYQKYGVPVVTSYEQNPTSIGNALLNLGTQILKNRLPSSEANAATNILQTAVQLAVTAVKAA
jgi:hypothetical protein